MSEHEHKEQSIEKSLSLIASSLYKMQLGVNSIRDELKTLVDLKTADEKDDKDNQKT